MTINVSQDLMAQMYTNEGENLLNISSSNPVLLVFLRHFGCTFCREALQDIAQQKSKIEGIGAEIIFVHMAEYDLADKYFARYELEGVQHVSDIECVYYTAFGLTKGNFNQLFGLSSWIRGFEAGVVKGLGVGPQLGDGFQMPGVFVIVNGEIKMHYIHKLASDRPDYLKLAESCSIDSKMAS